MHDVRKTPLQILSRTFRPTSQFLEKVANSSVISNRQANNAILHFDATNVPTKCLTATKPELVQMQLSIRNNFLNRQSCRQGDSSLQAYKIAQGFVPCAGLFLASSTFRSFPLMLTVLPPRPFSLKIVAHRAN